MIEILPNWHPIFVHFTVSTLLIAAAMHLLSHFVSHVGLRTQIALVARWNLWIGVASSFLTVAAGWYAYYTINHDAPSHIAMTEHRNWAMATLVIFLGIAVWEYYLQRHGKSKGWLFTGLLVIAASLLLSTAWHGGELVYRYGLGVMSMPKPEGPGHNHEHGEDHSEAQISDEHMPHDDADAHTHDDTAQDGHPHGASGVQQTQVVNGAVSKPGKAPHPHAPGTPPHQD